MTQTLPPTQPDQPRASGDRASENPEAYIARDRRWALSIGASMRDRVHGSALFADISGFTPLTEALVSELGPQRGAEELTHHLGRVFHAVIAELDPYDGNVIYFSGDAITCWLDGDDGTRAAAAALGMQAAMDRTGSIVTPGNATVSLSMKIAVAVGAARRFVVGDPEIQLIDVLAGRLIDDLAEAEHHAGKGEIVLEPSAIAALGEVAVLGDARVDATTGRAYALLNGLRIDVEPQPGFEPPALAEDLVRPWLLPAVYERLRAGRGEFLAELRPAFPLFVRFSGIDYDEDDDAIPKLDEFVRAAQRVLSAYGGNLLQVTLGDKGAYLYGVVGSPLAHEDDGARAAAAALEIRDLGRVTAASDIQVGIGHGRVRSGTYGHAMRRTFVCLGDPVNLSARLMSAAPAGRIYASAPVREAAGDAFIWEQLPPVALKGKAAPVDVWALNGSLERASRRKTRYELRLVGRKRELADLDAHLADALAGRRAVVGIAAEAGMGKSRLLAEFIRSARRRGLFVAVGECQAFGVTSSYFPWSEIWRRLLRLEETDSEDDQRRQAVAALEAIDPGLVARAPLLEAVVGLSFPDTELTASFDPKLRKTSLEALLATVLAARGATEPIVIVIEDAHWIDELSRDLLGVLVRSADPKRVLFVLAYRPADEPGGALGLGDALAELELDRLEADEAAAVVRSKVEQVLGAGTQATDGLVQLITERADGNPFYVEELVTYIAGSGADLSDPVALASLEIPGSLHSLVLSRIDTLSEAPRRTLKVASVVGRVFRAPVVAGTYPELGDVDEVRGQLEALRVRDLVAPDREVDLSYLFKHVVTQEIAYGSLPFALRTSLHGRVGRFLEAEEPDGIDQRLDLLAHHYWLGDDESKKVEFLRRAGDAAKGGYANAAAITYYERLIPLLDGPERVEVMLGLAKVLELTGAWARTEAIALEARGLAEAAGDRRQAGWSDVTLAEVSRKQGRYDEASERLDAARAAFEEVGADDGVGQVLHLAGTVAAQRGDYETARARYLESLPIRQRLGDRMGEAALYSNLGVVADYAGSVAGSREFNGKALEVRRAIGDRWAIGVSQNNLGMVALSEGNPEEALERFEESMRLNREVGDPWMVAILHNNLGNTFRQLRDVEQARSSYAASLRAYREYDDKWAVAFLLEDIAVLEAGTDQPTIAFELLGAAESLRESIGAPRSPSLDEELAGKVAAARTSIGEPAAGAAASHGRELGLADAIDHALGRCEVAPETEGR